MSAQLTNSFPKMMFNESVCNILAHKPNCVLAYFVLIDITFFVLCLQSLKKKHYLVI